ncbi:MAG: HEAT repeat domain-containing protein [Planctomycetota bacterium]
MALTIQTETSDAISLEEYLEHVTHRVDPSDTDQVIESAPKLAALANNRTFLVEKFNQELRDWRSFQPTNAYSAQTLTLGGGERFFVRANMWAPPSDTGQVWDWQSRLFAYSRPHDHNFSFLTVGYIGGGYGTKIYEYDPDTVRGEVGERVDLRYLETTALPAGKVMFYRASRDIHSQSPPSEFSMSLNFMVVSPEVAAREQYWFDLEAGTITGRVQNPGSCREMIVRLAAHVGDGATANLLEDIAATHVFPRVRAAAYRSLAHLEPGRGAEIAALAAGDRDPSVRAAAALGV